MKAVSRSYSTNLKRVAYREAFLSGYHCVEIADDVPINIIFDWLEKHGAKEYAMAGMKNSRCIAIKDTSIAALFKLTWMV